MRDKDGIEIELLPDGTWRKKEENNGCGCIGFILFVIFAIVGSLFGDKSTDNKTPQVKDNTTQNKVIDKQYDYNNSDYSTYENTDTQHQKVQSNVQTHNNYANNNTKRVNEDELRRYQRQLEKDLKKQAKEKARQEAQQAKAEAKQAKADAKQAKAEAKQAAREAKKTSKT